MNGIQPIEVNGHSINIVAFRKLLIEWGQEHFRIFPWRMTREPYYVLMAEIMLHRTQAPQVVPVYQQFIERYPHISALGQANKEELQEVLYSLGLRWRISLIQTMAKILMTEFEGQIPQDKADLLSLPGISDYIAGAVRCFAWNKPEPLIDTNVVRVISRLFGLEIKDSSRRNQHFKKLITTLVDTDKPRLYNYALLDLADQICMKKSPPECVKCPLQMMCLYSTRMLIQAE